MQLASGGTQETLRAAVIALISSMLSRKQTDLLWMFARRETAHSSFPILPSVKWCCVLTECQIVTGFLAQSQTWIENPDASIPQARCCISTGRAVARGSASFKCVRGARSPPPRRLWSKPHLRFLLRPDASLPPVRLKQCETERGCAVAGGASRSGVSGCEWLFEAARASQPRPEEEKNCVQARAPNGVLHSNQN